MGKKNGELSDKKKIRERIKDITNLQFKEAVCCKKLAELNTKKSNNGYITLKALVKFKEAIQLFNEAAENGHVEAQNSLATCYYNGQGVTKSFNRAVEWWTKAAMQGNVQAQYRLANCYDKGEGVKKNHKIAFKWWAKAADKGCVVAQVQLGKYYKKGKGVKKSIKWYMKDVDRDMSKNTILKKDEEDRHIFIRIFIFSMYLYCALYAGKDWEKDLYYS